MLCIYIYIYLYLGRKVKKVDLIHFKRFTNWFIMLNYKLKLWKPKCCIFDFSSVQLCSVAHSCPTLCDPMNRSTPGFPVHHQFPEFTQTQVYRVSDAIQPSHPLLSPSSSAPNPSQHQGLFQWINSSHDGAKVLEFQHQSFQWTPRTDLL